LYIEDFEIEKASFVASKTVFLKKGHHFGTPFGFFSEHIPHSKGTII
jgi:hypothetical protein